MNVYMAPEAEVIELNVFATVLSNSNTGEIGGDDRLTPQVLTAKRNNLA